MMKHFALVVLLLFTMNGAFAQLKIKTDKGIDPSGSTGNSIDQFVKNNQLEYALISWSTSSWLHSEANYYGIVKQSGNWYVVTFVSRFNEPAPFIPKLTLRQRTITSNQADSLLNQLAIKEVFKYTQTDFSKLPDEQCECTVGGKIVLYDIHDAGTYHLLRFDGSTINYLTFYAPHYMMKCKICEPQMIILEPFANACDSLYTYVTRSGKVKK